jgi:hypothetical protein
MYDEYRMSSIMRDASTLTQLKNARALYSYNKARMTAVLAGQTVKPEAVIPTNNLLNMRNEGAGIKFEAYDAVSRGCACTSNECSGSNVCLPANGMEH